MKQPLEVILGRPLEAGDGERSTCMRRYACEDRICVVRECPLYK